MKKIAIFLFALGAGLSSQFATATDRETCRAECNAQYDACVEMVPEYEYQCWKESIACMRQCP